MVDIRDRVDGTVAVIELSGRLTVNDRAGVLREMVSKALAEGARDVVIDLAGVRYLDSTRLGELIAAHVTVTRNGGRLKLVHTPERVHALLVLAGLDRVFDRYTSMADAERALTTAKA
jgi:anti-sigma B factor antagonist